MLVPEGRGLTVPLSRQRQGPQRMLGTKGQVQAQLVLSHHPWCPGKVQPDEEAAAGGTRAARGPRRGVKAEDGSENEEVGAKPVDWKQNLMAIWK